MSSDLLTTDGSAVTLARPANWDPSWNATGYAVMNGATDEVVVSYYSAQTHALGAAAYNTTTGQVLFSYTLQPSADQATSLTAPTIATDVTSPSTQTTGAQSGGVVLAWTAALTASDGSSRPQAQFVLLHPDRTVSGVHAIGNTQAIGGPLVFANPLVNNPGFHVEYLTSSAGQTYVVQSDIGPDGFGSGSGVAPTGQTRLVAYAGAYSAQGNLEFIDNAVYQTDWSTYPQQMKVVANIPGESPGAIAAEAAAGLAGGLVATVWTDSGSVQTALYDPVSHTFSAGQTIETGSEFTPHVVALPSGGYAVSWSNNGHYKGELFSSSGTGGGVFALTGDFAGLTTYGDLYTVGVGASGQRVFQAYALNGWTGGNAGAGPGGAGSTVATSDTDYRADQSVSVIQLTGSNQTVHGNNGGDIIQSDNTANALVGGTGNDTFLLGRAGDNATGGGGNDAFVFSDIPWAGGHITDFNAGDVLDLTGLAQRFGNGRTVADPWGQGYLKVTDDGLGDAQVWARYETSGSNSSWWLVTTLDHVSPSALQFNGDLVATTSSGAVGGGGTGQTFTSDNAGDHWTGTTGDDTFNLGRGGDVVTGAGGADTFKFAEMPWAGGHITDFGAGDSLDLTGLFSTTHEAGANPLADGYLKIGDDGRGDAQVWARFETSGSNSGWWLVETLDGVAPASVQVSGDVITAGGAAGGPTDVTTSDANYMAPASAKTITLAGSQQHIDASLTSGVTITSNDTGNTLLGGSGDDLFHLGRGGDTATGGAGADTFAYAQTPWAAGSIADFHGGEGDVIDVRGLLSASGYSGSDALADGYLRITDSAQGAQVWSDLHQPGNDGWWLVATLDGLSTSSLHYSGGLIT